MPSLMLQVCCLGVLQRLECFISLGSSVFFFLLLLLVKDWVLMVPGVVEFCSVVVWGIEWCVLCAGGCGIADPCSVEETQQRRGQVPQHASQSITSPVRASSPQGLANTHTQIQRLLQLCVAVLAC